ncbi:DNase I-like protein [Sporormia fimetaria CBS 119925]|uniref:DNase I-like protein n=1 Tax=Sporormia fimetaria CBS 119925 TaxID=1340428 RepID=A0A6A6V336_9PLEO|nr:DNase I-like protein [Sporormia fimetaria CBS 119925]
MVSSDKERDRFDAIPGAFPENDTETGSTQQSLSQALFERRAEYTRPKNLRIKVGTWNVAGLKGLEKDLGAWFVEAKGGDSRAGADATAHDDAPLANEAEVGIYALGLQEVVDINSPAEALRPFTDPSVASRWKEAIESALPSGYQLVAEQQLTGLLLLIYVSPTIRPQVSAISTTSVGTGLMGYMGNKGAVCARLVLGETTRLVFVNCHLAAGADKTALERRNWDAAQVVSRAQFSPINDVMGLSQTNGEGIGEEDFAFWFGDLNYRLEGIPGEDVRRLLSIHTKDLDWKEDDAEGSIESLDSSSEPNAGLDDPVEPKDSCYLPPDEDPSSMETTVLSLLSHDELHQQQKAGKAFTDGWKEGPIRFLPSYKYDVGKVGVFDTSEKRRAPSWCDRILYRTRAAKLQYDARLQEREEAKKRDEELKAKGIGAADDDESVLYDYDPETDGDAPADYDDYDENQDPEPEPVTTKEGFHDEIKLEHYTSHLRITSSDHKPLDATFTLVYDAVIPELKAVVHKEVAKELDRQENEGRPSITVVIERSHEGQSSKSSDSAEDKFDGVDFNDVQFSLPPRRNISIANTGQVPAKFKFMGIPTWLTLRSDHSATKASGSSDDTAQEDYTLEPGDACNIELKLSIEDIDFVRKLNKGLVTIDEVLIVSVNNGRDHFIPIRGHWLPTSFGRTIDELIKVPEGGVRKYQLAKPGSNQQARWSVPREIFRLSEAIETLTERTLADWGMTSASGQKAPWQHNAGWPFVKDARYFKDDVHEDVLGRICEALDCDTPFDAVFEADVSAMLRVELLGEVLLLFLTNLEDGVITQALYKPLEDGFTMREKAKQHISHDDEKIWILETLSKAPSHNATFLLLLSMLERLAREITTASKPDDNTPRSSVELPASPQVSVRRKTLSRLPEVAIRQLVCRNYAAVFADVVIKVEDGKMKEKEKGVRKDRMTRVIEVFLLDEVEGRRRQV